MSWNKWSVAGSCATHKPSCSLVRPLPVGPALCRSEQELARSRLGQLIAGSGSPQVRRHKRTCLWTVYVTASCVTKTQTRFRDCCWLKGWKRISVFIFISFLFSFSFSFLFSFPFPFPFPWAHIGRAETTSETAASVAISNKRRANGNLGSNKKRRWRRGEMKNVDSCCASTQSSTLANFHNLTTCSQPNFIAQHSTGKRINGWLSWSNLVLLGSSQRVQVQSRAGKTKTL